MLKWTVIFLVVGLALGELGFGGICGAFVGVARLLFFIAVALFVIFLMLGFSIRGVSRSARLSRL